jgi:hypothetical protein
MRPGGFCRPPGFSVSATRGKGLEPRTLSTIVCVDRVFAAAQKVVEFFNRLISWLKATGGIRE